MRIPIRAKSPISRRAKIICDCAQVVFNQRGSLSLGLCDCRSFTDGSGLRKCVAMMFLAGGLLFELALLNPGTMVSICTLCGICQG